MFVLRQTCLTVKVFVLQVMKKRMVIWRNWRKLQRIYISLRQTFLTMMVSTLPLLDARGFFMLPLQSPPIIHLSILRQDLDYPFHFYRTRNPTPFDLPIFLLPWFLWSPVYCLNQENLFPVSFYRYHYDWNSCSWAQVELVEPAITGTQNVLNACLKARVKKVVVVSSVAAVMVNPNWPKGQPMDENSWSDTELCKSAKVFVTSMYTKENGEMDEIIPMVQHYPWTAIIGFRASSFLDECK